MNCKRSFRIENVGGSAGGFTLPELLVVVLLVGIVTAGMGGVFASQNRAYVQQDLHVSMEENLRVAMSTVVDSMRFAGCGVPPSDLGSWISWVGGFIEDPVVVVDGGFGSDVLSIATCTPPVAALSARADAGTTSLSLASSLTGKAVSDLFNTADKGLISIGEGDYALIRSISGTNLTIDTDPTQTGNQGLLRSHPPGSRVSRVDVDTFMIQNDPVISLPTLVVDKHRGTVVTAADGISDLQVTTVVAGSQYRISLTGRSEKEDPVNGQLMTRTVTTDVTLRN